MTLVELARQFLFVRELPENRGQRVEAIQRWCGGKPGDSWCADFATMLLDIHFGGQSPIPRTSSCDELLEIAIKRGWIADAPHVGDLYLFVRLPSDAHHVGIVCDVSAAGFSGLSGNTSADGSSSNGDRVAERFQTIRPGGRTVFIRYPR
jgi:hypothetical protein